MEKLSTQKLTPTNKQLIILVSQVDEYVTNLHVLILVFLLYIACMLPFTYVLSFFFDEASTAVVRLTIFNVISGLASLITIQVLNLLRQFLFLFFRDGIVCESFFIYIYKMMLILFNLLFLTKMFNINIVS